MPSHLFASEGQLHSCYNPHHEAEVPQIYQQGSIRMQFGYIFFVFEVLVIFSLPFCKPEDRTFPIRSMYISTRSTEAADCQDFTQGDPWGSDSH